MSFTDPQSITISGTARSLVRVPSGKEANIGKFSGDDGNTVITVHQNSTNNRFRRETRLTMRKIAVDPISAENKEVNFSLIIGVDEPRFGFTDAEIIAAFTALSAHLSATSNARFTQLLNGEL